MSEDPEQPRGQYVNECREALWQAHSNISELARATGMERRHASEIVNGWRLPTAAQLDAMCAFLKLTADKLYREEFRVAIEATRQVAAS